MGRAVIGPATRADFSQTTYLCNLFEVNEQQPNSCKPQNNSPRSNYWMHHCTLSNAIGNALVLCSAGSWFTPWLLHTHLWRGTFTVKEVLRGIALKKDEGNGQPIVSTVFDGIVSSWLGSTTAWSCPLTYFSSITESSW